MEGFFFNYLYILRLGEAQSIILPLFCIALLSPEKMQINSYLEHYYKAYLHVVHLLECLLLFLLRQLLDGQEPGQQGCQLYTCIPLKNNNKMSSNSKKWDNVGELNPNLGINISFWMPGSWSAGLPTLYLHPIEE